MKKNSTLAITTISILSLVVLSLVFLTGARQVVPSNVAYQYNADVNKTIHDIKNLNDMGMTLENTSVIAKLTPDQAVEAACKDRPDFANQAKNIVVEYYQITDPGTQVLSDAAKQKNESLAKNGYLLKTPCYIVSFEGINKEASTPPDVPPKTFHEYNLVIDANSGEPLYAFLNR